MAISGQAFLFSLVDRHLSRLLLTDSHYFSITLRVVLNFSHIRGEVDTLLEAIEEAIRIGRETGAAVQISHFNYIFTPKKRI